MLRRMIDIKLAPWLVLVVSLIATIAVWLHTRTDVLEKAQDRFHARAEECKDAIVERMRDYEMALRGGVGLFDASEEVSRDSWRAYIQVLDIERHFPGTQGVGFSKRIPPQEKASHVRQVRAEGFPEYSIRPEGERSEYTSIIFLEPFSGRNLRAFGYDMLSEAVRRAAMERARDEGIPTLSGKVILVQETDKDTQNGALMYVPVYRRGMPKGNVEERRAALTGYVYSPLRVNDLMVGILGKAVGETDIVLYDGKEETAGNLLYANGAGKTAAKERGKFRPAFTETLTFGLYGRTWTIRIGSLPPFEATIDTKKPLFVLLAGVGISLLLFGTTFALALRYKMLAKLKQAEEALLETGALQRAIFNSANFSSIATDAKGVIQIFNVGAERMLGYTAAEVMNRITPADISDPQEVIARAKALSVELDTPITPGFETLVYKASRGIEDIYELTYIRKDGSRFPAVVSVTALRDAENAIIGYLLIVTDNTARKLDALKQANAYNRSLIEASLDPLVTIDAAGKITDANSATEKVSGYLRGWLIGTEFSDYFTEPERARAGYEQVFQKGSVQNYALEIRHRDGRTTPVLYNASVYRDDSGKVLGVFAAARDITDHKAAEEALRESERKYRLLIANAHEAIFIAQDNVVKFPNPKALEITGYSTEELAGVPFTDLIHPENRGEVIERYIARLQGRIPLDTYPFRIMGKTGGEIWVQLTAELIDWEGRPGVLCFLRDITKERNQDAQLQTAQKMEAVGTLAGGIAHDFNNSLTGILGFGELLRMRMAGDEQALHDLDEILRCAERAGTLTRQLLTFARRQVIEPVNLNLSPLISDLMRFIGKVVGEHIEVKTSLGKDVPTIHADRGQIEQVVMNLCLNARDAMPEGGRLVVETEDMSLEEEYVRQNPYMKAGRYALLTVSDTGVGMDEKTRKRVFEPFFTTKGPDKGTGLGLAMVYGIVKQHGGFIHLYSEPGKGTAFKVYFPAVEAPPDVVPGKRPEETVRGGTETILLAEDEESIRVLAERILTGFGYTVLVARNGEEAIEIFSQNKEIVLAVLDVVMPRKGGKEAFEEMYKQNPRLKVIFMSGYSANGIHDSFVLIAGTPFLQKPFGPTILARKVRDVLDTQ